MKILLQTHPWLCVLAVSILLNLILWGGLALLLTYIASGEPDTNGDPIRDSMSESQWAEYQRTKISAGSKFREIEAREEFNQTNPNQKVNV